MDESLTFPDARVIETASPEMAKEIERRWNQFEENSHFLKILSGNENVLVMRVGNRIGFCTLPPLSEKELPLIPEVKTKEEYEARMNQFIERHIKPALAVILQEFEK